MMSPPQQILRMGFGFVLSQALRVAAELKIADLVSNDEQGVGELAAQVGADPGALYRVMRLLASEGVFRETSPGRFVQTELSAALRSDSPGSPRDYIAMINSEAYQSFAHLSYSIRSGQPVFEQHFGSARFDWLEAHPEQMALFQRAMIAISQGANEAVAEAFDFTPYESVVDVGGGHGQLLSAILARNSRLAGVLFDRASSIEIAKTGVGGQLPRTQFAAGNFFKSVPIGADVYILKRVIHDWDDESAAAILRNCRLAMKPSGKLLIAERITPEGNDPDLNKYLDIIMLGVTGGIERTEKEFDSLLARAGLHLERVIPAGAGISVLQARAA